MKGSRFTGPADSPGFLLWQVTNAWQRAVRTALVPLDLTHVQFVLLASLAWLDDASLTQRELASFAGMDVMMTSQAVRTLERKSLIVRERSHADARARALAPTEAGARLVEQAVTAVEEANALFFATLGKNEPGFVAGLRALYATS